jgi:hypothetical protein
MRSYVIKMLTQLHMVGLGISSYRSKTNLIPTLNVSYLISPKSFVVFKF